MKEDTCRKVHVGTYMYKATCRYMQEGTCSKGTCMYEGKCTKVHVARYI